MSKTTVEDIKSYFLFPNKGNLPEDYAKTSTYSLYLVKVINHLFQNQKLRILELGSNVGRNLHYLQKAGHSVFGIEGSQTYYDAIKNYFPETFDNVRFGQIEQILNEDPNGRYDLVFTMAVLEHIPPEIEVQVFGSIHTHTTWLLTIEDECCDTWNHFPRNYKEVFPKYGFDHIKSWRYPPLGAAFVMRLFRKEGEK